MVAAAWGQGNIYIGELNDQSANYVAGYVVKGVTSASDGRLEGRYPEFIRMSKKPGLGVGMMDEVASTLMSTETLGEDVPAFLRHGKKLMPLGRYLRQQLRLRVGREKIVPKSVMEAMANEMSPVREFAFQNSRSLKDVVTEFYSPETSRLELLEEFNKKGKKL